MTMRRFEVEVPAETYDRVRAYAKQSGTSTAQTAAFVLLIGFQAIQGIAEGAQEAIDAGGDGKAA